MPASLIQNLRSAAHLHGDACAVRQEDRRISYSELWRSAQGLASGLISSGFRPGDRAAIALPNSLEYVQALYGVLLAGGIAVPLNAAARSRDFAVWLRHCEPRVVFAQRAGTELDTACSRLGQEVNLVHTDDAGGAFASLTRWTAAPALPPADDHAPAMIIYTSGTTGVPKGVTLSHGNLAGNTDAIVTALRLQPGDSLVNVLPFHFSYGNSVLHSHVKVAGTLILEQNLVYPHRITEAIQNSRATGFAGVPSTYALLLARGRLAEFDLSSLRYITQAGGPMPASTLRQLRSALPDAKLYAMYGQTEATARITCMPPDLLDARPGSVGLPIPGVAVQIRKDAMAALPLEEGEIWVSGPGVMLGYWREPDATREAIRDGWLRTGDIGRMDADGFLYVSGRRTDMIKVGANRVHPDDVEEVIAELPGIREVAAVGIDDELLGQTIRVLIVAHEGATVSAMQVQAHCRANLPGYKIPRSVVFVSALPRTASGKVRRSELARQGPE